MKILNIDRLELTYKQRTAVKFLVEMELWMERIVPLDATIYELIQLTEEQYTKLLILCGEWGVDEDIDFCDWLLLEINTLKGE